MNKLNKIRKFWTDKFALTDDFRTDEKLAYEAYREIPSEIKNDKEFLTALVKSNPRTWGKAIDPSYLRNALPDVKERYIDLMPFVAKYWEDVLSKDINQLPHVPEELKEIYYNSDYWGEYAIQSPNIESAFYQVPPKLIQQVKNNPKVHQVTINQWKKKIMEAKRPETIIGFYSKCHYPEVLRDVEVQRKVWKNKILTFPPSVKRIPPENATPP